MVHARGGYRPHRVFLMQTATRGALASRVSRRSTPRPSAEPSSIVIDPRRSCTSARAHWHLFPYATAPRALAPHGSTSSSKGAFRPRLPSRSCLGFAELRERASAISPRSSPTSAASTQTHPRDGARLRERGRGHHTLGHRRRHAGELDLASAGAVHPARHLRLHQRVRKR